MKATGYIETCHCCHSTREILKDFEMFPGRDGRVFLCFENGKTGERYIGSRQDVEFLIEYLQMRLSWMKEEPEPEPNLSLICSKCSRIVPPAGRERWLDKPCGEKEAPDDPGCDGVMRPVDLPTIPAECKGEK